MEKLSSCSRCVKNTAPGSAFWGYINIKVLQAVLTSWGGIIYGGVLTYEALRLTNCLPDDENGSCSTNRNDDSNGTPNCRRLWGFITPDSLLTVIATAGNIVIALLSAFLGTYMDSTPYRRQVSSISVAVIAVFAFLCGSIIHSTEGTLAFCSFCLFILTITKEVLNIAWESYAPELSDKSSEVAATITAGNIWFYACMLVTLALMAVIGFVILNTASYGFVICVISAICIAVFGYFAFKKLPNVPASRELPVGSNVVEESAKLVKTLVLKTIEEYPDYGLVLIANMIFDPAISAIFAVAIQVLVAEFHFTAQEIPIIFFCSLLFSFPGIVFSNWATGDKPHKHNLPLSVGNVVADRTIEMSAPQPCTDRSVQLVDEAEMIGQTSANDAPQCDAIVAVQEFTHEFPVIETMSMDLLMHPKKIKYALLWGLFALSLVTAAAPFVLQPCNLGLAILTGGMWCFTMCYNWNCSTMLRAALVPGGSEAEYAGLVVFVFNIISWLPLLIFLVMSNEGYLLEAIWSLLFFLLTGFIVLLFVDVDRGVIARDKTMHLRRWVRNAKEHLPARVPVTVVEALELE